MFRKCKLARVARLSTGLGVLWLSACTATPAVAPAPVVPPPPPPPAAEVPHHAQEAAYWRGFAAGRRYQSRLDRKLLANVVAQTAQPPPPAKPTSAAPPPAAPPSPAANGYIPSGPATPLPDGTN